MINEVQVYSKVIIDIAGEMINPGVYELKNTDRIDWGNGSRLGGN